MDKNEYNIRANEIRTRVEEKKYKEAVEIADTIDWRNVRNSNMLCYISDLYKMCKRFEDSRDVLMLAYQRNPSGRMILYSLCELSIKLGDVVNAMEYFKEFKRVAPKDSGRFVLKYKLYTAQEVGLDERIEVLEQLQEDECKEKWMYELAYLYHMQGYSEKCVDECNQIILYFGDGKYVIKALELKRLHEPLSYEQDNLYKRLTDPTATDILVKDMDVSKFNTIDLQKELANSLAEVLYDDSNGIRPEESYVAEVRNEETSVEDNENEENIKAKESDEEILEESVEETSDEAILEEPSLDENAKTEGSELKIQESGEDISFAPAKEPVSMETRIFNIGDVEAALKPEPGMARTVLPSGKSFDEMHEVMPKEHKNPAIKYSNFDDMVSLEGDGQISFNVPEQEMIDKQITGQISIDEIMAEWERMKNANDKKWRDDMRRKVSEQADVMFADFEKTSRDGLLEKLENEVSESETITLTKEEEENLLAENISHESMGIELFAPEEESDISDDDNPGIQESEGETDNALENEETEEVEEDRSCDIREIVIDEENDADEVKEEVAEEPTSEELFFDRTPFTEIEDKLESMPTEAEPESLDNTAVLPDKSQYDDYLLAFAEASEQSDRAYLDALSSEIKADENSVTEAIEEESTEEETEVISEDLSEEALAEFTEEISEESFEDSEGSLEDESEEEPEAKSEEESDNRLEEESENTAAEDTVAEEKNENAAGSEESLVRESGFTAEQEQRFEAFIQTEAGREQLKEVLENISMESGHGNVIIGSEDVDGSVELAKAILMELSEREKITGKVAKIKASTLNAKDAEETLKKLYNGALIIQDASELRPETLDAIRKVVSKKNEKIFIILTTTKRAKHHFIMQNNDLLHSFDVSIDIDALSDKELAAYAKGYAFSKEYAIDEMGMLALQQRIDEKQTNEHSVTITEVRDIVESAIKNASKRNIKHFMDVLVGKRYDDNDMIVLKEKDFME